MSLTIGASVAAAYAPVEPAAQRLSSVSAAASGGGDIVALSVAAQSSLASSSLLTTMQQTNTALGSATMSVSTDLTV